MLLVILGIYSGYKWLNPPSTDPSDTLVDESLDLPAADSSIQAELSLSPAKANTVLLKISGLGNNIKELSYEFTYDSEGLIKGVNSGSQPLSTEGKDIFEREIYLGTCSKNVCNPDKDVKSVSVDIIFTDNDGEKSQLTKNFTL